MAQKSKDSGNLVDAIKAAALLAGGYLLMQALSSAPQVAKIGQALQGCCGR